jgi:uncharacterized protein (TIGR03067 family)
MVQFLNQHSNDSGVSAATWAAFCERVQVSKNSSTIRRFRFRAEIKYCAESSGGRRQMQSELDQLQGKWKIVSLEVEGTALKPETIAGSYIGIGGANFISTGMGVVYKGTIELDSTANPKSFRMNFTDGSENGNTNCGIYELEGDSWRICITMTGAAAPTEFATAPNSGQALEVLIRSK